MGISENFNITLICLFCGAPLEGPEDKEYSSGDLIECSQCEEPNDYDSLIEVAKEKGVEKVSKEVEDHIKNKFSKLF